MKQASLLTCIALILAGITQAVSAAAVQAPTATEAIALALERSASIQSAESLVKEALLGEAAVRAGLGFRADLAAGDTLSDDPANLKMPGGEQRLNSAYGALSMRTHLMPGPEARLDLLQASLGVGDAQAGLEEAARETIVTVYDGYRQLETALLQQRVLLRRVEDSGRALEVARSRHANGTLADTELEEARLAHRQAQDAREAASRMLDLAKRELARRIGIDPNTIDVDELPLPRLDRVLQAIEGGSSAFFPPAPIPWEASRADLVAQALAARPEILRAKSALQSAEAGIDRARLVTRPQVMATAEYGWSEKGNLSLSLDNDWLLQANLTQSETWTSTGEVLEVPGGEQESWSVGVRVVFNLWDAGLEEIAIRRAEEGRARALLGLEQAENGIELDLSRRYDEALAAHDALWLQAERALLALAVLQTEQERHRLGLSSDVQLAVVSTQLDQAIVDALSARARYETALLRLAQAAAYPPAWMMELVSAFEGRFADDNEP